VEIDIVYENERHNIVGCLKRVDTAARESRRWAEGLRREKLASIMCRCDRTVVTWLEGLAAPSCRSFGNAYQDCAFTYPEPIFTKLPDPKAGERIIK
jgi:hypothetical protein